MSFKVKRNIIYVSLAVVWFGKETVYPIHYSADLIDYSTKNQISDIFPFLIISLIVSFCIWLISFTEWSYIIILIIQIIVGIGLYWFISEKLPIQEYQEVRQLVFSLFKKK